MSNNSIALTKIQQPYKVLIVDDDANHLAMERDVLRGKQYYVTEASSAEQALELLCKGEFDVVLADKRMPGMDGDELCRCIREDLGLNLLPVIMVTASCSRDDLLRSLNAGANDFIHKPYNTAELVARTDNYAAYKRLTDQMEDTESLLFALARMVEARDENTGNHCSRLAHSSVVIGKVLGLASDELIALNRGGVLHDIGKLGIPDSILLKNGPLNDEEWRIMRQHTVIGAELLSNLKNMKLTLPIVRSHHEAWDGSGYPDGLRGEEIPLLARVFQFADIYDALAFDRPYKSAFSLQKIITVFEEETAKGLRDPALSEVFLDILHRSPEDLELPKKNNQETENNMHGDEIFQRIMPLPAKYVTGVNE